MKPKKPQTQISRRDFFRRLVSPESLRVAKDFLPGAKIVSELTKKPGMNPEQAGLELMRKAKPVQIPTLKDDPPKETGQS